MRRTIFESLKRHLFKKEYTILTGARQTGKSTLLRQLEAYCKDKSLPHVFLNLERKSILEELNENPINLLQYFPETDKKKIALIDEVQYLEDPSNFLKLLYDEHADDVKIIATGSSAFYMDRRFKDSLAGRKQIFRLLTCSFNEYLGIRDRQNLIDELERITRRNNSKSTSIDYLKNAWEDYMIYGGYPAVITEPDKRSKISYLKEIRDAFIKRDILESGVVNETGFYHLFRILADQSGNLLNVNKLSKVLRLKNETVNNYLFVLQKCFHLALIKPFYRNLKKELTKMPKAYLLDTGLRNCLLNNFQPLSMRMDNGELWEATLFRLLAEQRDFDDIFFWRTTSGKEVDFVLPHDRIPLAIEAKYDSALIKQHNYEPFYKTYSDFKFKFSWMKPLDEDFFRRIASI